MQQETSNQNYTVMKKFTYYVGLALMALMPISQLVHADCASNHTIHYTVGKGSPTAYFRALDGSPANALTVGYTQSAGGEGGDASGGAGGGGTYVPGPVMQYKQFAYTQFNNVNIPTGEITYTPLRTKRLLPLTNMALLVSKVLV